MKHSLFALALSACLIAPAAAHWSIFVHEYPPSGAPAKPAPYGGMQSAVASFYGHGERLRRRTATGEVFNARDLTAASRDLPFGTIIRVWSANGASVDVRINDRGPAKWTHRDLDLSWRAAQVLGYEMQGVTRVKWEVIGRL